MIILLARALRGLFLGASLRQPTPIRPQRTKRVLLFYEAIIQCQRALSER
jgi:hypothetical protein